MNTTTENTLEKKSSLRKNINKFAIYGVFAVVCVVLAIMEPTFVTSANIINVLRQLSITGYIAVGMLMVIITGGIDLSAGMIVALCGAIGASFAHPGQPAVLGILLGLGVGALCGAASGALIAFLKLPPFIATLGVKLIVQGAALIFTNGHPVTDLNEDFLFLGGGSFLEIPIPVWILIICLLVGLFLLNFTKFGRHVYAIGGNELSAQLSGVNVKITKMMVYVLAGVFAALSGLVLAARTSAGAPTAGLNYEMDAITICVIGGCSLSGGSGSIVGTIAGMLLIGVITNGMNLMNVSSYWQLVVKGVIIILAVIFDIYSKKRK